MRACDLLFRPLHHVHFITDEIAALEQRKRTLEVAFETYTGVKKMKSVVSKPRRVHRL